MMIWVILGWCSARGGDTGSLQMSEKVTIPGNPQDGLVIHPTTNTLLPHQELMVMVP